MTQLTQIAIPNAPTIPGLRFRMFAGENDLPPMVALNNAVWAADKNEYVDTLENARHWFTHLDEKHNPMTDMLMVEVEGVPGFVARAETGWMSNDVGEWLAWQGGYVHPAWRGKGIGRTIQHWLEQRGREILAERAPADAPQFFQAWSGEHTHDKTALLTHAGFVGIRFGCMMLRPLDEPIPELPLPADLEVRPTRSRDELRPIFDALNEAFRDHWGHREWTDSDFQGWYDEPDLDTSLYQVAWDIASNQIAGGVLNHIDKKQNEQLGLKRGWTDPIFVRRPWRKRGVAKALIARSLQVLKEQGMSEAALGVDTQNPNGAYKLYESMGFRVYRSSTTYRKPVKNA